MFFSSVMGGIILSVSEVLANTTPKNISLACPTQLLAPPRKEAGK